MRLILASTSTYRRSLLARLGLPFEVAAPGTDETPLGNEPPGALALRLARAKAGAVSSRHPDALVIGSDQVAWCEGRRLDKPGVRERAIEQLTLLSGRTALFHTAVCVVSGGGARAADQLVTMRVGFRELERGQIERYVDREQPWDCAGSAKSEGMGIALLRSIEGGDPNALVGLPLIALVDLLREFGVEIP